MTDSQIIQGLQLLSIKLIDDMRFAEAEFVDQAIARIMSVSAVAQRVEMPNWERDLKNIVDYIARGSHGSLND